MKKQVYYSMIYEEGTPLEIYHIEAMKYLDYVGATFTHVSIDDVQVLDVSRREKHKHFPDRITYYGEKYELSAPPKEDV